MTIFNNEKRDHSLCSNVRNMVGAPSHADVDETKGYPFCMPMSAHCPFNGSRAACKASGYDCPDRYRDGILVPKECGRGKGDQVYRPVITGLRRS